MKKKHLLAFFLASLVEGILALSTLLTMTFDPGRGHRFNYVNLRLALAGIVLIVLVALIITVTSLFRNADRGQRLAVYLDMQLVGPKKYLFFVQGAFIVTTIFLFECFLMTYLAIPVPMRPLLFWAGLTTFQIWLVFRIAYAGVYRERSSLIACLRTKWNGLLPMRRKVFAVITILGLLYFAAFIPSNLLRDEDGNFFMHADEKVLYPDVTQGMLFPNTISGMVHSVLESWSWQYGYPYFTVSAAALLIPRLVFGNQFAEHVQLNIFLLRQLVNVAPMTLALLLAVFLVTQYKSMRSSVGMFVFLSAVPGIVKYNFRFWHADGLVVLLVILTIFSLQRDKLRFERFFYLAAVFCSLAAAIKLWGLFFGPVIAIYLLAGLYKKQLTVGKLFLSGSLFILAMLASILISSPTLMAPYIARVAQRNWLPMQGYLLAGYAPDSTGEYQTGLINWLKYFGFHYMKGYFFYFSFFALVAGSLWGSKITLNRILLGWCVVTTLFLANFVALKNFQYMLPLAVPLTCGAFLFPTFTDVNPDSKIHAFLARPIIGKIVRAITTIVITSQFIINLVILGLFSVRGR